MFRIIGFFLFSGFIITRGWNFFILVGLGFILFRIKLNSRLIRVLLVLELLVLISLFICGLGFSNINLRLRFLFLIIIFRVGEATLGLSLLVRYRRSFSDQVSTSRLWEYKLKKLKEFKSLIRKFLFLVLICYFWFLKNILRVNSIKTINIK